MRIGEELSKDPYVDYKLNVTVDHDAINRFKEENVPGFVRCLRRFNPDVIRVNDDKVYTRVGYDESTDSCSTIDVSHWKEDE